MNTIAATNLANDLHQFTGTENWYRHPLSKSITYTDGVRYLAKTAGAYWLLDAIVSAQFLPEVIRTEFQLWRLTVDLEKSSAVLKCEDGDYNVVYSQKIEFTDFPLPEVTLFFCNNVIHLPSEY